MRNKIYINFKLGMDQAFITMRENEANDSRATDGVRRAERRMR